VFQQARRTSHYYLLVFCDTVGLNGDSVAVDSELRVILGGCGYLVAGLFKS
jgi:hypothetical protein